MKRSVVIAKVVIDLGPVDDHVVMESTDIIEALRELTVCQLEIFPMIHQFRDMGDNEPLSVTRISDGLRIEEHFKKKRYQ